MTRDIEMIYSITTVLRSRNWLSSLLFLICIFDVAVALVMQRSEESFVYVTSLVDDMDDFDGSHEATLKDIEVRLPQGMDGILTKNLVSDQARKPECIFFRWSVERVRCCSYWWP